MGALHVLNQISVTALHTLIQQNDNSFLLSLCTHDHLRGGKVITVTSSKLISMVFLYNTNTNAESIITVNVDLVSLI